MAATVGQVLAVVQSFLVMRFLVPSSLGVWITFSIVLSYFAFVHLGVEFGLVMRLPFYRGRGDEREEGKCEDSTFFAWTVLALLFAAGLVIYALAAPGLSPRVRNAMLFLAVMAPLEQQSNFLGRWQTSSRIDFKLGSYVAVARSLMSFLLLVPLAYFFGVTGLMIGALATSALVCLIWWRSTEFRFHRHVTWPMIAEMFEVGFPVLLVSLSGLVIQTIDRLLIASRLGTTSLGYYGATGLGGGFLYAVLSQAGNAMSPHIAQEMGRSGGRAESLEKFLVRPTILLGAAASAGIMLLLLVIPSFIRFGLPRYVPGIPAVYGFLPGFFFLSIVLTAGNILLYVLIERGQKRFLLYAQGFAIAVEVCCALIFIEKGWGILGVSIASTISYAVYGCGILVLAANAVIPERGRRLRFLGAVIAPFFYCGAVVAVAVWATSTVADPLYEGAMRPSIGLIGLIPLAYWMDRRLALGQELAPVIVSIRKRFRFAGDGGPAE